MRTLALLLYIILTIPTTHGDDALEYWNGVIAQYEALCDACISGQPKPEIEKIKTKLTQTLKKPVGTMNAEQKVRFERTKNRYRALSAPSHTVVNDTIRIVEHRKVVDTVFVKEVLGRIEHIITTKDTVVHILKYNTPEFQSISRKDTLVVSHVFNKPKNKVMIAASIGVVPDRSFGLMVAYGGVFGGYIRFRSNFSFRRADYNCNSDGSCGSGTIWTTGASDVVRLTITAGPTFRVHRLVTLYAGAGYGERRVFWEDSSSQWAMSRI